CASLNVVSVSITSFCSFSQAANPSGPRSSSICFVPAGRSSNLEILGSVGLVKIGFFFFSIPSKPFIVVCPLLVSFFVLFSFLFGYTHNSVCSSITFVFYSLYL